MLLAAYTDINTLGAKALAEPLSDYRRDKLQNIRNQTVIRQGLAAERLLETLVSRCIPDLALPLTLTAEEGGKPRLSGDWGLHMNLSHSGQYAACALADHPVGIDIQVLTLGRETLLRRCFTEKERSFLAGSADPERAFTLLWALKESYLKLTGEGLRIPMNSFSVDIDTERGSAVCADAVFSFFSLQDACLAVCVPHGCEPRPKTLESIRFA